MIPFLEVSALYRFLLQKKKCDKRLDLLALVSGKYPASLGSAWCRFHCIHLSGGSRVTLSPSTLNGGQRKDSQQKKQLSFCTILRNEQYAKAAP